MQTRMLDHANVGWLRRIWIYDMVFTKEKPKMLDWNSWQTGSDN